MSSLNYPASLKIFIFFFLALGILQIPFLTADADINLGASRGPWTDEGMYTMQVRNALLTGTIDINETDGLIKEPLFSVMAFAILGGIDNSMTAMRSAGLAYCCFMLALLASGENPFSYMLRICIPIGFLSYYPLQYSHLAMVEMSACVSVLLSIFFIYMRLTGGGIWNLYLASAFALITYAFKIQFVYVAIVPPLAVLINLVLKKVLRSPIAYQDWIDFLILLLLSGI